MHLTRDRTDPAAADSQARAQLQRRRLVVAAAVTPIVLFLGVVNGDPGLFLIALVIGASGAHAIHSLRRSPGLAVTTTLIVDIVVLVAAVAVIRPPAAALIGPAVYVALSALVFVEGTAARVIAVAASAGAGLTIGLANFLAPRAWDPLIGLAIVAGSVAVSTSSVIWLLGRLGDIVDEQRGHQDHLAQLFDHHARVSDRLSLVLDTAAEGIYGVDADGIITFANKGLIGILGYEPAEVIGRHAHDVMHRMRPDGSP